jgi:hypothetical protein
MSYKKLINNLDLNYTSRSDELSEYRQDFLDMNIGSIRMIMESAKTILESLESPSVQKNLTASWLQGKIAITEDYMRTIHDFVKYVPANVDKSVAGCGCGGGSKKQNRFDNQSTQQRMQDPNKIKQTTQNIHQPIKQENNTKEQK